jgi:hypothetical protein
MRELLENTAQRAISYLEGIGDRSVAPSAKAVAKLATLDEPLNEGPTSAEQVIKVLDEICTPATMAMAGPRSSALLSEARYRLQSQPTGLPARGTKTPGCILRRRQHLDLNRWP